MDGDHSDPSHTYLVLFVVDLWCLRLIVLAGTAARALIVVDIADVPE